MSIRDSFENKQGLMGGVAILLAIVATVVIIINFSRANSSSIHHPKWMFDLNTGKLVIAPRETPSPTYSDSGVFEYGVLGEAGAVVNAIVFSCGKPTAVNEGMTIEDLREVDAQIGYLQRRINNEFEDNIVGRGGDLIATSDGVEWFGPSSPMGMQIKNDAYRPCPNGDIPLQTRP
ncbi:MAG: hypothetical protein AAGB29_14255 [Planctomycetota bacterium]